MNWKAGDELINNGKTATVAKVSTLDDLSELKDLYPELNQADPRPLIKIQYSEYSSSTAYQEDFESQGWHKS